jgi:putative proteasome-type protease
MTVFENPGDRLLVLMSAGNLAITQAVRQIVCDSPVSEDQPTIWTTLSLHEAARIVGAAIRQVRARDIEALSASGIEFNCSFILGGQIKGGPTRLFHLYAAGNFIEATPENPYFQIGEAKYGKPIVDRIITPHVSLDEAAKCALISMDSTLRSNISVGLPLDLLVYETDSLALTKFVQIDERNQYLQMIRSTWGGRLKQVFQEIPNPCWTDVPLGPTELHAQAPASAPIRALRPSALPLAANANANAALPQWFAEQRIVPSV